MWIGGKVSILVNSPYRLTNAVKDQSSYVLLLFHARLIFFVHFSSMSCSLCLSLSLSPGSLYAAVSDQLLHVLGELVSKSLAYHSLPVGYS